MKTLTPFSFALGGQSRRVYFFIMKPKQYQIGIDTFERSESNLTKDEIIAICKFNIDKYCWRKKDQDKDDFKKIIDYANWAIKNL